jgi:predicted anti-sigma-YlaC factor YlaD
MSQEEGISCRDIVALTTDYLEGTLPQPLRRTFEAHLALCEGCDNYLDQMRETIRLTGLISEDGIPPEQRAELVSAFRDWRRGR